MQDRNARVARQVRCLPLTAHDAAAPKHNPRRCTRPLIRMRRVVKEIVRTNDPVVVSAVVMLLEAASIPHWVMDQNMSVLEGSIGILPRRVLVLEENAESACALLREAGLGHELRPDVA